jgi:hypothetical protein
VGLITRGYWRIAAVAPDEANQLSRRHEDFAAQIDSESRELHATSRRIQAESRRPPRPALKRYFCPARIAKV